MWTDPSWEEMLKDSQLIALVEVVEGGTFVAKVKPLTTFKGAATEEFYVTGFCNSQWPDEAIERESFKEKQQYYLFLRRSENAVAELEFWDNHERESAGITAYLLDLASGRRFARATALQAARSGALWRVWTPSAGDLPVAGDVVRYHLSATSYPHHKLPRPRAEFETFLRAAAADQGGEPAEARVTEAALNAIRQEAAQLQEGSTPGVSPSDERPSELSHQLGAYFLAGGRRYDPAFEQIARGRDVTARFMLVRVLGAITEEPADQLLLAMIDDANALVQGEVVRQLTRDNSPELGPILHSRLMAAADGAAGPTDLMDPVRNSFEGGRLEIVRALGELRYGAAAPDLIQLLESTRDGRSMLVLLDALEKMDNRDYAPAVAKALGNLERISEAANWARDHRAVVLKPVLEQLFHDAPPSIRTVDLAAVADALGKIGDDATAGLLTAELVKLTSKRIAEFHDQSFAESLIGALAALRYAPARAAIDRAFFHFFAVDSAFARRPELLAIKQRLEVKLQEEARNCLGDFRPDVHAQAFLQNRTVLVNDPTAEPRYSFALQANVRWWQKPWVKAEALHARLVDCFRTRDGVLGVTRWQGNMGQAAGSSDERISDYSGSRSIGSTFLWRYGQYVDAVRHPDDIKFVKFLLSSGLVGEWRDSLFEGLGTTLSQQLQQVTPNR